MAVRVVVRGRVQGVFFRASTREEARRRGVTGWVRNDPSGTVTAHLEGDDDAVRAVVDWMRAGGPRDAAVVGADETTVPDEHHAEFRVTH